MITLKELSSLSGRSALITGATGHLGRVIADTLAEQGADLILVDRPGSDFIELNDSIKKNWGVKVSNFYCDLESQVERNELIKQLLVKSLDINILVNNAAFVGTSNLKGWALPFSEQSIDTWRRALEVNLTAVFHLCQSLMPVLEKAQGANILNIGSIYGQYGPDWGLYEGTDISNPAAYGASKGGLIQFTRWLATTVGPKIRVNAISPGGVFRNQNSKFVERYERRTPLRRMAKESDFKGAVAFLVSDLSEYVTGQNIQVDGGWGVW